MSPLAAIVVAVGATIAMLAIGIAVVFLLIEFVNFSREWFPRIDDDEDLS